MLYILLEPIYKESLWCREITDGIVCAAKEKRIPYTFIDSVKDDLEGQVIVVATSIDYINLNCKILEKYNIKTVVATPKTESLKLTGCSFVGFDSENAIIDLNKLFCKNGKGNVALFGVNESSVNDLHKKHNFLLSFGKSENVFYNNGDIKKCFNSFYDMIDNIDAVLCTNSYVAFYLVQQLKKINFNLEKIEIVSLSDSKILSLSSPGISAVGMDYFALGKTAFDISRILGKNSYLNNLSASVKWKLMLRDTTKPFEIERFETLENEAVTTAADFYVDSELSPIMKTERLFDGLDEKDLEILKYLIKGTKQEEICDRTFMSESGVKYRIKKMLSLSETVSKSELVDLISKFDISI